MEIKATKVEVRLHGKAAPSVIIKNVGDNGYLVVGGAEIDSQTDIKKVVQQSIDSAKAFDSSEMGRVHRLANKAARAQED